MIAQVAIHCAPLTDTTHKRHGRIAAGRYLLVVESKQGRTQGMLQLWPTSSSDRSPTHPGVTPALGDADHYQLYGATNVVDSAMSTDPLYP